MGELLVVEDIVMSEWMDGCIYLLLYVVINVSMISACQ